MWLLNHCITCACSFSSVQILWVCTFCELCTYTVSVHILWGVYGYCEYTDSVRCVQILECTHCVRCVHILWVYTFCEVCTYTVSVHIVCVVYGYCECTHSVRCVQILWVYTFCEVNDVWIKGDVICRQSSALQSRHCSADLYHHGPEEN